MLMNIHRIDTNIGDLVSSPLLYFKFPKKTQEIDIMTINDQKILENDIVIGGGGLLSREFFAGKMNFIANNKKGKLISWGIGHNSYEGLGNSLSYPAYMDKFDLHGIRDYDQGFNYVPCASCMSSLFDKQYKVKHEVVIYKHRDPKWKLEVQNSNFPIYTNQMSKQSKSWFGFLGKNETLQAFSDIIKFLGEADTILTNSYHGMYWGILLNKKVLAFPFSTKFYTLKYQVPLCDSNNWQEKLKELRTYPDALGECREANRKFYEKVMNLLI